MPERVVVYDEDTTTVLYDSTAPGNSLADLLGDLAPGESATLKVTGTTRLTLMGSTSEKLNAAATAAGWQTSRLRANGGKVAVDYFSTGNSLMKVEYDSRGRLVEVLFYDERRNTRPHPRRNFQARTHRLGRTDTAKTETVLGWLKSPPGAKQIGVKR